MTTEYAIHWFRRDLRLEDNNALAKATQEKYPVKCIFIFDTNILEELPVEDKRVSFIKSRLDKLRVELQKYGSDLFVFYGEVTEVWKKLLEDESLKAVYTNEDYEPYAVKRDNKVAELLATKSISFYSFKDQVIFEKTEIQTQQGNPYSIYTPYSKSWKKNLKEQDLFPFEYKSNFLQETSSSTPTLETIGFKRVDYGDVLTEIPNELDANYGESRDYPILDSTSHLSVALRFGTVSVRQLVKFAQQRNHKVFLGELIWREFFMQILWNYPNVVTTSFRKKYDGISWRNNEKEFEKWREGKTGYPIVDAGMRELNATGYMHNRVRMITASFLVKHLLVDWRWGEAYFAEKLLDFDLSANNGNWQWVAGCGTDAAPYFRVFNPEAQQKKFDAESAYILKWVPEYGTLAYPQPIVGHKFARERCLDAYKDALI